MRLFGKKKPVVPEVKYIDAKSTAVDNIQVVEINSEAKIPLGESLGVTEERSEWMARELFTYLREKKFTKSRAAEEITKKLKHPNEVFYLGVLVGRITVMETNPGAFIISSLMGGEGQPPKEK
jgi:hypothetical protein